MTDDSKKKPKIDVELDDARRCPKCDTIIEPEPLTMKTIEDIVDFVCMIEAANVDGVSMADTARTVLQLCLYATALENSDDGSALDTLLLGKLRRTIQ